MSCFLRHPVAIHQQQTRHQRTFWSKYFEDKILQKPIETGSIKPVRVQFKIAVFMLIELFEIIT